MESNVQKMREALNRIGNIAVFVSANCGDQETAKYMTDIIMEVQSAVALPLRNCEVGTAEEQHKRMKLFCQRNGFDSEGAYRCEKCELFMNSHCELAWAQMPYEATKEGGAK